jgi:hypothetical protein
LCALRRAFCGFLALFGSLPVVVEDRIVGFVDGMDIKYLSLICCQRGLMEVVDRWFVLYCALFVVLFADF